MAEEKNNEWIKQAMSLEISTVLSQQNMKEIAQYKDYAVLNQIKEHNPNRIQGEAVALPYDIAKIHLSTLTKQIDKALVNANNASRLDDNINHPEFIIISEKINGNMAYSKSMKTLAVGMGYINEYSLDAISATIEHELSHNNNSTNLTDHQNEYKADRGAHTLNTIKDRLEFTQKRPKSFDKDDTNNSHPNASKLIKALLKEEMANGIFQGNVKFYKGEFHPLSPATMNQHIQGIDKEKTRKHSLGNSLLPATEDLRLVTNWKDIETKSNIEIDKMMQDLTEKVKSDGNLTPDESQQFMSDIKKSIKTFKENNPIKYDDSLHDAFFDENNNPKHGLNTDSSEQSSSTPQR